MNLKHIKTELKEHKQQEVEVFISYIKKLQTETDSKGQLKAWWITKITDADLISLYQKVSLDGLFIDGDTITLQWKGGLMVSYNYQAYKNKLLMVYPETLFDIQLVNAGDTFSFRKESGRVVYNHDLANPFETNKDIIGAYCVIKNSRGEFLETLNLDEIQKMRNVAKTQKIWNEWTGEMILKSVIKRSCKRHFNDVTVNIDNLDNENYNLEMVSLESEIQDRVQKATNRKELAEIYKAFKDKTDEKALLESIKERQEELNQMQVS